MTRNARRHGDLPRPRTTQLRGLKPLVLRERPLHLQIVADDTGGPPKPRTRGDCIDGPRPCPWISCRYHLAFEITEWGGIRETWPTRELAEVEETCALDVADRGGESLHEVGACLNVTRERIRQVEESGMRNVKRAVEARLGLSRISWHED